MAISGLSTGIDLASRLPRDTRDEFTSEYRERLERELEAQLEPRAADDEIADVVDLSYGDRARAFDAGDANDGFSGFASTTRTYSSPPEAVVRGEVAAPGAALDAQSNSEELDTLQSSRAPSSPYLSIAIAAYGTRLTDAERPESQLSVRV